MNWWERMVVMRVCIRAVVREILRRKMRRRNVPVVVVVVIERREFHPEAALFGSRRRQFAEL